MFKDIIPLYVSEYLECPSQQAEIDQLFINFARLPVLDLLIPIPSVPCDLKSESFPSTLLLNEYFDNIERVEDMEEMCEYTCLKIEYLIRYLEEMIEKDI